MIVLLSDKAKLDLFRIYRYLEARIANAANDFIQRVDKNFENLARFLIYWPETFEPCSRAPLPRGGTFHLIFYTVESNQITAVRVIDGRMDVEEEFHR